MLTKIQYHALEETYKKHTHTHARAKQKPKTKNSGFSTKVSENTEQKREVCKLKMNLCCFFIFISDYVHLDICNLQILFCTNSKKSHRYFNLKINFDGDENKKMKDKTSWENMLKKTYYDEQNKLRHKHITVCKRSCSNTSFVFCLFSLRCYCLTLIYRLQAK